PGVLGAVPARLEQQRGQRGGDDQGHDEHLEQEHLAGHAAHPEQRAEPARGWSLRAGTVTAPPPFPGPAPPPAGFRRLLPPAAEEGGRQNRRAPGVPAHCTMSLLLSVPDLLRSEECRSQCSRMRQRYSFRATASCRDGIAPVPAAAADARDRTARATCGSTRSRRTATSSTGGTPCSGSHTTPSSASARAGSGSTASPRPAATNITSVDVSATSCTAPGVTRASDRARWATSNMADRPPPGCVSRVTPARSRT